MNSHWWWFG